MQNKYSLKTEKSVCRKLPSLFLKGTKQDKDNTIEGLTSEQISNIYVNNAYENWNQLGGPDALLYPYCRNNDSGSHAQMEKHFLNGNEIHSKIMSETRSEAMQSILTDVIDAKTEEPLGYGLGYSIYYYYHK